MAIDTNSKVYSLACRMSILKVTVLDFKLLHKEEKRSSKALKNSNREQSQSSWKKDLKNGWELHSLVSCFS